MYCMRGVGGGYAWTHPALLPVLHVESPESDVSQIEVAADAEAAHHVVDDHVQLGVGLGLVLLPVGPDAGAILLQFGPRDGHGGGAPDAAGGG